MYSEIKQSFERLEGKIPYDIDNPTRFGDIDNTYLPTRNQRTPAKVIKQDLKNGQKYEPEKWSICAFPKVACRLNTLNRFYPREPVIANTRSLYNNTKNHYYCSAFTTTVVSWFAIFQFARRGRVLPIFRQYGRFFGTHRIFRQYIYAAILPISLAYYSLHSKFSGNVNHLWAIHARRLNNKILDDSMGSTSQEATINFRVNVLKSVIPQQIDIQQHANARLSLAQLGDNGIQDFEFAIKTEEIEQGGDADGGEAEGQGEETNQQPAPEQTAEEPAVEQIVIQQTEQKGAEQLVQVETKTEQTESVQEQSAPVKRKIKLSELDLDNLDVDSINIDDLDLSEFGIEDDD